MTTREFLHMVLVFLMAPFLLVAWTTVNAAALLAELADRVLPDARRGNCWSFALAKFRRDGGYVGCRPVAKGRMLGGGRVLHVFWVRDVEGKDLVQTQPLKRREGLALILFCWYFSYRLITTEPARRGQWHLPESVSNEL